MLVFFRFPKGSTMIDGRRIYGFLEPYDPVRVSWDTYRHNRNSLIQASYDPKILGKMFPGREFPNISFTYHEMRYLTWEQMCSLCQAFDITTSRSNTARRSELRKFFRQNC